MGRRFLNYFETIYGLEIWDRSSGTETIKNETIIGLRPLGRPESMRP